MKTITNKRKKELRQYIRALQLVKRDLDMSKRDKDSYICVVLLNLSWSNLISSVTCDKLRMLISNRLNWCSSVELWLASKGISAFSVSYSDRQEYRQRWLDNLINEFEKELNQ